MIFDQSGVCLQNSIRHNLSLHSRFEKIQNEGTGKSSWWQINHNASRTTGKSRRRATSMDTPKFEKRRGRVKKVVEAMRNGLHPENTPSPSSSISENSDMIPVSPLRGFQFRLVFTKIKCTININHDPCSHIIIRIRNTVYCNVYTKNSTENVFNRNNIVLTSMKMKYIILSMFLLGGPSSSTSLSFYNIDHILSFILIDRKNIQFKCALVLIQISNLFVLINEFYY